MKTHSAKRVATILAAALMLAVLWPLTVSGQSATQEKPQAQGPAQGGRMGRNSLNLTPEQQKKLQDFREARMKGLRAFRDQMMKMGGEMRELNKDPQANEAKIDALIDQMYKLRADRAKMAIKNRAEIMNIFTPEQRAKLKQWRESFRGGSWFGARGEFGFAGPRMAPGMGMRMRSMGPGMGFGMGMRAMGPRGWRAWRMGRRGMFRRHPFFWMAW